MKNWKLAASFIAMLTAIYLDAEFLRLYALGILGIAQFSIQLINTTFGEIQT